MIFWENAVQRREWLCLFFQIVIHRSSYKFSIHSDNVMPNNPTEAIPPERPNQQRAPRIPAPLADGDTMERLFQALFYRIAVLYARAVPKHIRRLGETALLVLVWLISHENNRELIRWSFRRSFVWLYLSTFILYSIKNQEHVFRIYMTAGQDKAFFVLNCFSSLHQKGTTFNNLTLKNFEIITFLTMNEINPYRNETNQ